MKKAGFTLIELLTVIAIIGILATFLTANFVGVRQRARDSQRKSDLKEIQAALELYRADEGGYAPTSGPGAMPSCGSALTGTSSTYMSKIPCDPSSGTSYAYAPTSCSGSPVRCTSYTLTACLENASDSQANGSTCNTTGKQFIVSNP